MSAKPSTLPLWATTGSIGVPPTPTQQQGHLSGQSTLHIYQNWYQNLVYLWCQYLNDGDVALNNVTLGGTLGVTGASTQAAITASGLLTANGGITVPTGKDVALAGTTTLEVGGVSTLTGALNANGGIVVPTGKDVQLQGTTTLEVGGAITANGGIAGPLKYTSIAPAALSAGNSNDYNPTGFSAAVIIRITTAGGGPVLTGISGGTDGRILYLYNVGADTIQITHLDGSSAAANQIFTPAGTTINLATNQSLTLLYDGTSSKWRLIAKNF